LQTKQHGVAKEHDGVSKEPNSVAKEPSGVAKEHGDAGDVAQRYTSEDSVRFTSSKTAPATQTSPGVRRGVTKGVEDCL
jgi:hypothetical protein